MGSSNFSDTYMFTGYRGEATAQEAYQHLCDDARHEFGHSGYNGTISTTRGVHVRQATPVTMEEARRLDEQHYCNLDKWSHCEAVALVEERPAQYGPATRHDFTIECSLTDANDRDALRRLAARHLSIRPERIGEVHARIVGNIDVKVTAAATAGGTETRFFVLVDGDCKFDWEKGYKSQAEARASLDRHVKVGAETTLEIVSMTRRVTGEPLVTATATPRKVKVRVGATERDVLKKAFVGTKQVGWYFYGWAAS